MTGSVSLVQVFVVILVSSVFSLGGGNGTTAVIQSQWVEQGHLDAALFTWVVALSHLSPGPKAGFLSGVGYYLHGLPGAVVAVVGIIIPTCVSAAGATYLLGRLQPILMRVRLTAGFIIAGMVTAAAWGTAAPLRFNAFELLAVAGVAVLVGWRNVEPLFIILGAAAIGLLGWLLL